MNKTPAGWTRCAYRSNLNHGQQGSERFGFYNIEVKLRFENHQKEYFSETNGTSIPDAAYYYDGDGKRIKKVSDLETTIFVYDAGGQLVAEYSTQTAQTPRVSYLTTDHLGSPRVITNENGAVTNRKDYTAFGEVNYTAERTQGLGYDDSAEETRKGYTGYEKDDESGLDFAQARYYNSIHGRFTSVDPLTASASIRNPQTFNRYSYVLNSPYKFTDPLGLLPLSVACNGSCHGSFMGIESGGGALSSMQSYSGPKAQQAEPPPSPENPVGEKIEVGKDKVINKKLEELEEQAKPLEEGEVARPTTLLYIPGEKRIVKNGSIFIAPDGETMSGSSEGDGYGQTVGIVVLDQGGNIMVASEGEITVKEAVTPVSPDSKKAAEVGRLRTTPYEINQQSNGVFYDLQYSFPGQEPAYYGATQNISVYQNNRRVMVMQNVHTIHDDANLSVKLTPGNVIK